MNIQFIHRDSTDILFDLLLSGLIKLPKLRAVRRQRYFLAEVLAFKARIVSAVTIGPVGLVIHGITSKCILQETLDLIVVDGDHILPRNLLFWGDLKEMSMLR